MWTNETFHLLLFGLQSYFVSVFFETLLFSFACDLNDYATFIINYILLLNLNIFSL